MRPELVQPRLRGWPALRARWHPDHRESFLCGTHSGTRKLKISIADLNLTRLLPDQAGQAAPGQHGDSDGSSGNGRWDCRQHAQQGGEGERAAVGIVLE